MKKLLCMICALTLACSLAGCQNAEPSLYDRGMETVGLLAEAVRSGDYLDLMTVAEPLRSVIADAAGDYSSPTAAFRLTFPADALLSAAGLTQAVTVPETLEDVLTHRLIGSLIPQINAMGGAEILAAASVCTVSKTFVCSGISEDQICLYLFSQGCPVAVTFTTGEDDTVTATASLILYPDFPGEDIQALQQLFGDLVHMEPLVRQ